MKDLDEIIIEIRENIYDNELADIVLDSEKEYD